MERTDERLEESQTVNFRIDPETHELVRRAAEISGKSVTAFMTEAAVHSAQKELLDQRFVGVSGAVFDSLLDQLEEPAKANAELVRLFRQQPEWID